MISMNIKLIYNIMHSITFYFNYYIIYNDFKKIYYSNISKVKTVYYILSITIVGLNMF